MPKKQKRDIELFIIDLFVAIRKIKYYINDFDDKEEFRQNSLESVNLTV